MGAGSVGLTDEEQQPERLEREVENIRDNMSDIVGELDRRRHELFDWRSQLRKHGLLLAAVGVGWVLAFSVTLAIRSAKRRRENRPLAKARRLRAAVSRMIAHPELVAQPQPSVTKKALAAAASATMTVVARTLTEQLASSLQSGASDEDEPYGAFEPHAE